MHRSGPNKKTYKRASSWTVETLLGHPFSQKRNRPFPTQSGWRGRVVTGSPWHIPQIEWPDWQASCSAILLMAEILHQLIGSFPIIYRVSYIPGGGGAILLEISEFREGFPSGLRPSWLMAFLNKSTGKFCWEVVENLKSQWEDGTIYVWRIRTLWAPRIYQTFFLLVIKSFDMLRTGGMNCQRFSFSYSSVALVEHRGYLELQSTPKMGIFRADRYKWSCFTYTGEISPVTYLFSPILLGGLMSLHLIAGGGSPCRILSRTEGFRKLV